MTTWAIQYTFCIHDDAHMHMSRYHLRLNAVLDFAVKALLLCKKIFHDKNLD
jgi:hypothetical protein